MWMISSKMMAAYESSPSSPEPEGESSAGDCLAGAQCALWSEIPTPQASWLPAKTTAPLSLSRSGMTYARLTDAHGEAVLTWSREGFRARISASQGQGQGSTPSDPGSGKRWRGSFAKYDPHTSSWKTPQRSLLGGFAEFSGTWPRWGMMRSGECSEQTPPPWLSDVLSLRSRTTGIGSGSSDACERVPTPTVTGNHNRKGASPKSGDGLATYVERVPTPTACMSKGSSSGSLLRKDGRSRVRDRLDHYTYAQTGGTLSPMWVEWIMGWPIGWTDCEPLATDRSRRWLRSHGVS